ncbi:MAG: serine protease [Pirellulales bacterium]|nr:serine protease [Pirellulales bacterium]
MRKILLSLLLVGLMTPPAFGQCGPWGCPVQRQPAPRVKIKEKTKFKRPIPAWRYERPIGHRAAVVRVYCKTGGGTGLASATRWSKGSGVLVRWGKRVVVITARHVVKDAKTIFVDFFNRRRHRARVLRIDARWDCAVLDIEGCHWLSQCHADGIEPARMAFGADATFHDGDRLESCGYGPDGKLAVNIGLFKGYRRSSAAMDGPDDWMVISGHARQGDSGGPVFDRQGRVVGVLWGTDGQTVVCVQPGRIHVMLDGAIAEQLAIMNRRPTPPALGPLVPVYPNGRPQNPNAGCPGGQCPINPAGIAGGDKTLLPWRGKTEATDKAQDARIDKLIGLMEGQVRVRPGGTDVDVSIQRPSIKPPAANERSPLLGGLCVILGVVGGFVIYFATQKGE